MHTTALKIASFLAIAALCMASNARADVVFCNKFAQPVYVAIAYPQADGSWMSRGWLELAPDECRPFDTALHPTVLYYRGETGWFTGSSGQNVRQIWGGAKMFATWEKDNFEYWDADQQVLNSSLEGYSEAVEFTSGESSATITFEADGKHTTTAIH
ncbi:MAG TPA: DUF1036 domain-containing protein [Candidatus Udaeobacter sp.]|nr:DUF1036 domain-containing protein [Candidatus Udaeobacter sp.]